MPSPLMFLDRDTEYVRIGLRAMRLAFERETREEIAREEAAATGKPVTAIHGAPFIASASNTRGGLSAGES